MAGEVWAVLGGKGGTGKSMLAAAMATQWAAQGKRVVLVDLSCGMRCQDMLFGQESRIGFDLGDVLEGGTGLEKAIVTDRTTGVQLIAAPQFAADTLNERTLQIILEVLAMQNDRVLLDTPGGITQGVQLAARYAHESLLVTTPDDISLRDAERTATLLRDMQRPAPYLVVSRIDSADVDAGLHYAPEVCAQVLDVPLRGVLPEEAAARRLSLAKQPGLEGTHYAQGVENLLQRLTDRTVPLWAWQETPQPAPTEPPAPAAAEEPAAPPPKRNLFRWFTRA